MIPETYVDSADNFTAPYSILNSYNDGDDGDNVSNDTIARRQADILFIKEQIAKADYSGNRLEMLFAERTLKEAEQRLEDANRMLH